MKSKGRGPQNGISALIRGGGDKGCTCTTEEGHASTKQEEVPPPELNHAGPRPQMSTLWTVRTKCLLCMPPVYAILLGQPRTKTGLGHSQRWGAPWALWAVEQHPWPLAGRRQ